MEGYLAQIEVLENLNIKNVEAVGEKDAEGINELWRVSCSFFDSHEVELLLSGEYAIIMTTFS